MQKQEYILRSTYNMSGYMRDLIVLLNFTIVASMIYKTFQC